LQIVTDLANSICFTKIEVYKEEWHMKQFTLMVTFITLTLLFTANTYAASSEVVWKDYKSYRDIHEGNEGRKQFRERTFKAFEKHFAKLAESLPEDQILKIEVTDVDLAGDTHLGGINRVRIIKDLYIPRMDFSYQLVDKQNQVILTDEVKLKDINFMNNNSLKYRNKALGYEKKMLDDWFADTFNDLITNH
jgi:hypothetical protein